MAAELWVAQLGRVPYAQGVELQARIRSRRQAEEVPDALLLLEHPPVYTKGRRTEPADLPMGEDWYLMQGIEVCETDRGGRVTYHGPGQLVGYPIVRIDDVPAYVHTMERAIVGALAEEGVEAEVREGAMDCFRKRIGYRFAETLGLRQRLVSMERLAGAPEPVRA
jgi:lipoyl(octanoyl) transferase